MHILLAHNDYAKFSGEESAVQSMADLLRSHEHEISWLRASSSKIGHSFSKKIKAFFSGIYSFEAKNRLDRCLDAASIDLVQVQNLYPFLSPSILLSCKQKHVPVVMRCPNYRLFCPTGLHFTHSAVCERCLYGKEWNCVLYNCGHNYLKSFGYALRNATARISGMIYNNVSLFIVLSKFQKERFIAGGINPDRIDILPNAAQKVDGVEENTDFGDMISFVGRVSPEKGVSQFLEAARNLPTKEIMSPKSVFSSTQSTF